MRAQVQVVAAVLCAVLSLAGCSLFGGGSSDGQTSTSVFDVQPGECFVAPKDVKAELADLSQVPCTQPHTQEAYAKVTYLAAGAVSSSAAPGGDAFPGGDVLDKFAKGACAQRYRSYVGVDYLDSKYFFTYLLPSARSWEQSDDREILCFVTTTGGTLKTSVKGSRR
jgi:hypothetical protein